MGPRASNGAYGSDTLRFLQVQYDRLRHDEPKLRQLLGN